MEANESEWKRMETSGCDESEWKQMDAMEANGSKWQWVSLRKK